MLLLHLFPLEKPTRRVVMVGTSHKVGHPLIDITTATAKGFISELLVAHVLSGRATEAVMGKVQSNPPPHATPNNRSREKPTNHDT